jgi:hypothetical protein
MSKPGIVYRRSPDTENLLRLWPGAKINGGWLREASIDVFAFGIHTQANALALWTATVLISDRWTSASRASNSYLDPETEWCAYGRRQPGSCCKHLKVTLTAFIMLFSTQPGLESCQEAATG